MNTYCLFKHMLLQPISHMSGRQSITVIYCDIRTPRDPHLDHVTDRLVERM
jgi:hypothetical protein